jgi:hypothetical protein
VFYISGNELRAMCTEPARRDVCAGFVAAVAESSELPTGRYGGLIATEATYHNA